MRVGDFLKTYFQEAWDRAQRDEFAEVLIIPNIIYNCWYCDDPRCPTGVHLGGWKVILEYIPQKGWFVVQVGDAYCSKVFETYIPDNWDRDILLEDLWGDALLKTEMEKLHREIKKAFGIPEEKSIKDHNEEAIKEYEEALNQLT